MVILFSFLSLGIRASCVHMDAKTPDLWLLGLETLLPQCYFVFIALVFNILLSEDTIEFHPPPTTTLTQPCILRFLVTCYPGIS